MAGVSLEIKNQELLNWVDVTKWNKPVKDKLLFKYRKPWLEDYSDDVVLFQKAVILLTFATW